MAEKLAALKQKGGGNLSETVLWTNASPTSAFSAQDVTLSQAFTDFDYVRVYYKTHRDLNNEYYSDFLSADVANSVIAAGNPRPSFSTATSTDTYCRVLTYKSNTKLNISVAYALGTTSTGTSACIPKKICGLK